MKPLISARHLRTVQLGVKSLLLHKMRSILTMLGIIFGVCSVIAMLAIGEGASYEAQEAIKKLGSANVILRSVKPVDDASNSQQGRRSYVSEYGLTYADVDRLKQTIPGLRRVLPIRILRDDARVNESHLECQVIGTTPLYAEIHNLEAVRGRFLADIDERQDRNVCVMTATFADRLFPYQDPLGGFIRIGSDYYHVVGLVRETGTVDKRPQTSQPEGHALDQNVYIPLGTMRARFGETVIRRSAGSYQAEKVELHEITVQMRDTEGVEIGTPQLKTLLDRFHPKKDYEMIVPLELLKQAQDTKRRFNIVLGSIAAISLIVGGIGIMNIMLATVTERTREIGVRRALGAKKKDIITQFLVETVVLSVGGGLIGVVIGVIVPFVVEATAGMKTIITFSSLVLSFGISGIIGVVFGLYPANRAASLDPIEALRHE
ncbi:MAG: ABC transporter permease [Verrucomicrobia bacterium]|nr:ABC transporter permease [Verrucomicrobiota bacterium]